MNVPFLTPFFPYIVTPSYIFLSVYRDSVGNRCLNFIVLQHFGGELALEDDVDPDCSLSSNTCKKRISAFFFLLERFTTIMLLWMYAWAT